MKGALIRMIRQRGNEYEVLNAPDTGDRSTPNYSIESETIRGIMDRRSMPTSATLSSGETIEINLEIRALIPDTIPIHGAESTEHPTKLRHPDGSEFQVITSYPEDSGVDVLTVVSE